MIRVAAGILAQDNKVLICQRRGGGSFGLKWEFPGGKLQKRESPAQALVRELAEELGIEVMLSDLSFLDRTLYRYSRGPEVEIHFFHVPRFRGKPTNHSFKKILWERREQLLNYDFLEADRALVADIAEGKVLSLA